MMRNIWRNLYRRKIKYLIVIGVSLLFSIFLIFYSANIYSNQNQLKEYEKILPVTVKITDKSGNQAVGLKIRDDRFQAAEALGMMKPILYSARSGFSLGSRFDKEVKFLKGFELLAVNSLSNIPSLFNKDITYLDGFSEDDFFSSNTCLISEIAMKKIKISSDNNLLTTIYDICYDKTNSITYHRVGETNFKVIGTYDSSLGDSNILCSLSQLKKIYQENAVPFYYDSAQFTMTNPLQLSKWKLHMREIGFRVTNPQAPAFSRDGDSMIVYDSVFINAVSPIMKNINMMNLFYPFIFSMVSFVGFLISNILIQSRSEEIAINRSLGMSRLRLFLTLLIENSLPCILGILIGAMIFLPFIKVDAIQVLLSLFGFGLFYLLGCSIAIAMANRQNVIQILTATE